MLLYENLRLAFHSLRANKMRSLLTMLGIIIGISSVIAIMTVGNSITNTVTGELASMGASNITVYIQQKTPEDEADEDGAIFGSEETIIAPTEDDYISKEMIEQFMESYPDEIYTISLEVPTGSGQATLGKKYANIDVNGVNPGYFLANDLELFEGRFFSVHEAENANHVAVISDKAVNNLFGGDAQQAIGSELSVVINEKYYSFTVVGVYEYQDSMGSFSMVSEKEMRTDMYIPISTARSIAHREGFAMLTVMTKPEVNADDFAGKTKQFFNTYYRNNRNFEVAAFSMSTFVESMTTMLNTITMAISLIAGIALLVGGIGVMNIMLVSITERTREIGTRKALGAKNSSIRTQFIIEAVVICLVGGLIGIIIGVLGGMGLSALMEAQGSPSVKSIVGSVLFSMAIGVFFGYYPANKAAKMDPIEALRYE